MGINTTADFAEFIQGQFEGMDGITIRRMFGGYCLYLYGRTLGFLLYNQFLMEDSPTARRLMPDAERVPLFPGAKDFVIFPNVENARYMQEIAMAIYEDLPIPKPRKSKKAKEEKAGNAAAGNGAKAETSAAEAAGAEENTSAAEASTKKENKRREDLPPEINDFLDFRDSQE